MSRRKSHAPWVLTIGICLAASPIRADEPTAAQQVSTATASTSDLNLLPQLGGAIAKPKNTRTVADNRGQTTSPNAHTPRAFKPVSAAKIQPMPRSSQYESEALDIVASRAPVVAKKTSPSLRFVENPFIRNEPSNRNAANRSRHQPVRLTAADGVKLPMGPQLQYRDLPPDLRKSLESKIKNRTESIGQKRLTAQLDDPFRDDPIQTPPPARPQPGPVDPTDPVDVVPGGGNETVIEVVDSTRKLDVTVRRSKLLRTSFDIYRAAVVDTSVCDVVQYTPREVSIIGRGQGATHVTFWFEDGKHKPVTYLVRVVPDPEVQERREEQYTILEEVLAEMFPDSKVHLIPVSDKLIVKGQAKGAAEAAQILAIIRGQSGVASRDGGGNSVIDGQASDPIVSEATSRRLPASNVINMLRVPGVQQVALRVKIAELNRSAARGFGVDIDSIFDVGSGTLAIQSLLNFAAGGETATSILGNFSNNDIQFGIRYLQQKGIIRIVSEPTLVTMSGREANFIAGGEFAVPTTVGVGGAAAVTTDFRAFGAIISFLPTVIDKDHIRLQVSPEFSKVNDDLSVGGTPGLDTRSVTTTVELREGQTLAIAGLLEDSTKGETASDLPIIGKYLGRRDMKRNETELIIIVTPELVHPMDPEEVPPLPGFDVTEPTDREFFLGGRLEGRPTVEHRSTVWPSLRRRYQAGGDSMISGPFGHGQ